MLVLQSTAEQVGQHLAEMTLMELPTEILNDICLRLSRQAVFSNECHNRDIDDDNSEEDENDNIDVDVEDSDHVNDQRTVGEGGGVTDSTYTTETNSEHTATAPKNLKNNRARKLRLWGQASD